jgi:hypothetical protein
MVVLHWNGASHKHESHARVPRCLTDSVVGAQVEGAAVQVDAAVGVAVAVASLESVQSHQGPGSGLT